MHFLNTNENTDPFFKDSKIIKFSDKLALENCFSISDSLHKTLPKVFSYWFSSLFRCTKTMINVIHMIFSIYVWNYSHDQQQQFYV